MPLLPLLHLIASKPLLFAALPPLSWDERASKCLFILEGTIEKLEHREIAGPTGKDWLYTATFHVLRANVETLERAPAELTFTFVRPAPRPAGSNEPEPTGPTGQYSEPPLHHPIRVFLETDGGHGHALIDPNGWEDAREPYPPASST